jgi:hypothetical protein
MSQDLPWSIPPAQLPEPRVYSAKNGSYGAFTPEQMEDYRQQEQGRCAAVAERYMLEQYGNHYGIAAAIMGKPW